MLWSEKAGLLRGACGWLLAQPFINRGTKPKANRNEGEEADEVRTGGWWAQTLFPCKRLM